MTQRNTRLFSTLLLLLTAVIWGFAFVAQSVSMDYIGPCTFTCARFLIGAVALLPFIFYMDHKKRRSSANAIQQTAAENNTAALSGEWKKALPGGLFCGTALGLASLSQQIGIQYTTVGKAGFITTLYIIIVPFFGLFLKKRVSAKVWTGAVLAAFGLYLICVTENFQVGRGDAMVLLCAFLFAVQILLVDHFSPHADPVKISCIQFFVAALLGAVGMFLFEAPKPADLLAAAAPILYAGVLSSGCGYTFQVVAQRNTDPTVASLILSLESVFSVLAGWLLLSQLLTARELFGCVLVFAAVILAQLPDKKRTASSPQQSIS